MSNNQSKMFFLPINIGADCENKIFNYLHQMKMAEVLKEMDEKKNSRYLNIRHWLNENQSSIGYCSKCESEDSFLVDMTSYNPIEVDVSNITSRELLLNRIVFDMKTTQTGCCNNCIHHIMEENERINGMLTLDPELRELLNELAGQLMIRNQLTVLEREIDTS